MGYAERCLEVAAYKNLSAADRTVVRTNALREYSRFRGRIAVDSSLTTVADQVEYDVPAGIIGDFVGDVKIYWGVDDYEWSEREFDLDNVEMWLMHQGKIDDYFRLTLKREAEVTADNKIRLNPPDFDGGNTIYIVQRLLSTEAQTPEQDIDILLILIEALALEKMIGAQYQNRMGDISYDLAGIRDRIKELKINFYNRVNPYGIVAGIG
jgi:hypothetical protein